MPSRLGSLGFACLWTFVFGTKCILDVKAARDVHHRHQRMTQVHIAAHGVATSDSTLVHQFGDEVEDFAPRRDDVVLRQPELVPVDMPNNTVRRGEGFREPGLEGGKEASKADWMIWPHFKRDHEVWKDVASEVGLLPEDNVAKAEALFRLRKEHHAEMSLLSLLKEAEKELSEAWLTSPWKRENNLGSLTALFSVMHFHSSTHLMIHDMILFARFLFTDYSILGPEGAVMPKEKVSTFFVKWQTAVSTLLERQLPNTAAFLDIDMFYRRLSNFARGEYTERPWSESRPDQRDRTNLHSMLIDTIVFDIPQNIPLEVLFRPMFIKAEIVEHLTNELRKIAEWLNKSPNFTDEMDEIIKPLDRILGLGPDAMGILSSNLKSLHTVFTTWRTERGLTIPIEAKDILRVEPLKKYLLAFSKAPEWLKGRPNLYSSNVPQSLDPKDTVLYEAASSWRREKEANCGMRRHEGFYRGSKAGHLLNVASGVEYAPSDEIPEEWIALQPQFLSPFAEDPDFVNKWLTGGLENGPHFVRAVEIEGRKYQFGFNIDGNFAGKSAFPLPSGSTGINGIVVKWDPEGLVPVNLFQSDLVNTLSFVGDYVEFRDANIHTIVAMWAEVMRLHRGVSAEDEIVCQVFEKLNLYVQHLYDKKGGGIKGSKDVQEAFTLILGLRVRSTCQTWEMPFERQSLHFTSGVTKPKAGWLEKLKEDPDRVKKFAQESIQRMKHEDVPNIIQTALEGAELEPKFLR